MRKRIVFLIILLFVFLLCFPRTALSSAQDGLLLWYHSVFPVLFPFLFLSSLLVRIVSPDDLPKALTRPFMYLFGCSSYGVYVILAGFVCGFPVGVRLSAELYQQKKISRNEAIFLQGFANNLSPGFILSYLSAEQMKLPGYGGWFVFQILGAAALAGIISARRQHSYFRNDRHTSQLSRLHMQNEFMPDEQKPAAEAFSFTLIDDCLYGAINSALRLCAYIMLFAILCGFLMQILPVSNPVVLLLASSVEVTNGIRLIAESPLPYAAKYVAVSALAAFGGWSALAQSAGIARMDRELLFHYTKSRVKITLLASTLSFAVLFLIR